MRVAELMVKVQPIVINDILNVKLTENDYCDVDMLPVTDSEQHYIGSINKELLAKEVQSNGINSISKIKSLLKQDLCCVSKDSDMLFLARNSGEAVVVDGHRVIGVVTKAAMIKALSKKLNEYKEQFETATCELIEKIEEKRRLIFRTTVTNQDGVLAIDGKAKVYKMD